MTGRKRSCDDDESNGKRQKNRDAAIKSRQKKKSETQNLKKSNDEYVRKNKELTIKKEALERQLSECINEIRKHKNLGCSLPQNVAAIIESPELSHEDFLPVGTQTIPASTNGGRSVLYTVAVQETKPLPENQPIVKGLFSGNDFSLGQTRSSNLSHSPNSSSRSPPTQHIILPSQPSTSSTHQSTKQTASWTLLHQHTLGEETALSPAQTVPNIDTVSETSQKYTGFPDINEAVQNAEEDPGIVEDEDCLRDSNIGSSFPNLPYLRQENSSFVSLFNNQSAYDHNTVPSMRFSDSLKPSSSSSVTVSMNHTAELVSQAMTNFDVSEIGEDLKKEIVRVTANQEHKEDHSNSQNNQILMQKDYFVEGVQQNQLAYPIQQQSFTSDGNNTTMVDSEGLLQLAKDQGQTFMIQFQGKEYRCNYETIQQLASHMRQNEHGHNFIVQTPQSDALMTENKEDLTNNFQQFPVTPFDCLQEPTQVVTNHNPVFSQNTIYTSQNNFVNWDPRVNMPPADIPAPVQNVQLPTTVLSMILKDSLGKSGLSSDNTPDCIDYSENVKELPSLSLGEDHSNIFEKKRRINND